MTNENSLVLFRRGAEMLAQADTIQKTKELKSLALTAAEWAKRKGMGEDAVQYCRSYALEAERKMGEMLLATERSKGGNPNLTCHCTQQVAPTLPELGISRRESAEAQRLAKIPDSDFEALKSGKVTKVHIRRALQTAERAKRKMANAPTVSGLRIEVFSADIRQEVEQIKDGSLDWIITDPPYPKEFTLLFSDLAKFASRKLKPGGSLIAMTGQSYLDEYMKRLGQVLNYQWLSCYFAPGNHTRLWDRRVMTGWKPLLWFVKGKYLGEVVYDVFKSEAPDKSMHEWGQSESGMIQIVKQFCAAGDIVCDPFMGAGTTGIAAITNQCHFIGFDIDEKAVATSRKRLGL